MEIKASVKIIEGVFEESVNFSVKGNFNSNSYSCKSKSAKYL